MTETYRSLARVCSRNDLPVYYRLESDNQFHIRIDHGCNRRWEVAAKTLDKASDAAIEWLRSEGFEVPK